MTTKQILLSILILGTTGNIILGMEKETQLKQPQAPSKKKNNQPSEQQKLERKERRLQQKKQKQLGKIVQNNLDYPTLGAAEKQTIVKQQLPQTLSREEKNIQLLTPMRQKKNNTKRSDLRHLEQITDKNDKLIDRF